jgi:dipeptidyl aminopeptidase/acylaminoacyl peptidase
MRTFTRLFLSSGLLASAALSASADMPAPAAVTIPTVAPAQSKRLVTVEDIAALRRIPALNVSADGRRYAIYVRQADAKENRYRNGWFVGEVEGGPLRYVGDGGVTRLLVLPPRGSMSGDLEFPEVHWSPDNQWIAYTLLRDGEVQLWLSKADGGLQEQISRNPSDVVKFAWSEDGRWLMYSVGRTRAEKHAQAERRERSGYRYDEDLYRLSDLMSTPLSEPTEKDLKVWLVELDSRHERPANEAEQSAFKRALDRQASGTEGMLNVLEDAAVPPVSNVRGERLWLKRMKSQSMNLQLVAARSGDVKDEVLCADPRCIGIIRKVWWSVDGRRAMFLRYEGEGRLPGYSLLAWQPGSARVATVASYPHDFLNHPQVTKDGRLVVVRESLTVPPHVAVIDEKTGKLSVLADVNPEFRNIHTSRAERIEWDAPKLAWNEPGGALAGSYPRRNVGYIIYPPDFDPSLKYPIFLDPYAVMGFSDSVGHEHPTQAYAAAGMVVLNSAFPDPGNARAALGENVMLQLYSEDLDFPHMTMLSESTFRGLDAAVARGFVDATRVGIGGVSHGTFIPLYMVQKHDRITAISTSAASWAPEEYFWSTRKGREARGSKEWYPQPVGRGLQFWKKIDIAENIDEIEAPILMHHALREAYLAARFMRLMADADKPYDAYVYTNELHQKWQPAHLRSVMERNHDWFRFWLQDVEDPAADKLEQYERWRVLRKKQCKNPRSLRDYCAR